jgi:dienelactone hydrolase
MGRSRQNVSTHAVASLSSKIEVHVFEPPQSASANKDSCDITGTIVTVHPWATLGGGEHNTIGLARHITSQTESKHKWRVITFSLQSTPIWRGGAVWGILSKHSYEVEQIVDVTKWAMSTYGPVVLLGSSAGAPMAGSAMEQLLQDGRSKDNFIAYVAIGYTFGNFASLGFGRHFSAVTSTGKTCSMCGTDQTSDAIIVRPKLFIMGEKDEFTTVTQMEKAVAKMKANCCESRVDTSVVADVGHFELESPGYDAYVSKLVLQWLENVLTETQSG